MIAGVASVFTPSGRGTSTLAAAALLVFFSTATGAGIVAAETAICVLDGFDGRGQGGVILTGQPLPVAFLLFTFSFEVLFELVLASCHAIPRIR